MKKYGLNELYKILKCRYNELLKRYNCDEISDVDYFFYGINYDIVTNCLNIVTNILSNNIESAGVDISCRSIIEAMLILKLDANGIITDNQKKIYRYSYAYVEEGNYKALFGNAINNFSHYNLNKIKEDKDIFIKTVCEHFKCEEKDLKKHKNKLLEPCFYLKSKLNERISFPSLLSKYPIFNEGQIRMYEFFSLFIHPRCEMNLEVGIEIMEHRKEYVYYILNMVFHYLLDCNLHGFDENVRDFNQDFYLDSQFEKDVNTIREFEKTISLIKENFYSFHNGTDNFGLQFIKKIECLVIDMIMSLSFNLNEHVISCFKSFIEEFSIFFAINLAQTKNEFDYLKKGYWLSSRVQLDAHFQEMGLKEINMQEELLKIYNGYYKEKYKLDDYDKFCEDLKGNSLYFIQNEKKDFTARVNEFIEYIFGNDNEAVDEIKMIYKFAKDMIHDVGYNFNSTPGLIELVAHKTLFYSLKIILINVLYTALTLSNENNKVKINSIHDSLVNLINYQSKEIEKVYKKYQNL